MATSLRIFYSLGAVGKGIISPHMSMCFVLRENKDIKGIMVYDEEVRVFVVSWAYWNGLGKCRGLQST